MAAAIDAIFTIKDLYEIGKDVYDRVQKVKDNFKDSRDPLVEQLEVILATLKKYEELEQGGRITYKEKNGQLNAIGIAVKHMREHIKKAEKYMDKFEDPGVRRKLKNLLGKSDIESKFASFKNDLQDAFDRLSNALQPYQMQTGNGKLEKKILSSAQFNF